MGTRRLTKDEFLEIPAQTGYEFYKQVEVPERLWKEVDSEWVKRA